MISDITVGTIRLGLIEIYLLFGVSPLCTIHPRCRGQVDGGDLSGGLAFLSYTVGVPFLFVELNSSLICILLSTLTVAKLPLQSECHD